MKDAIKKCCMGSWLTAFALAVCGAGAARAETVIAVASSTHSDAYAPAFAVDGKADTRWASRAGGAGPEWLQVDLGKPVAFSQMRLRWERACARDYEVQASDDAKEWRTLVRRQGSNGGVELLSGLDATARYVRILCRAAGPHGLYSLWEVEFPEPKPAAALAGQRRAVAEEARARDEAAAREGFNRAMSAAGRPHIVFAVRKSIPDGHWYANFGYYAERDAKEPLRIAAVVGGRNVAYQPGGRLCRLDGKSGRVEALLDDPEGGVRDPFVDPDGRTILFSYRQGTSPHYHLHTIRADGSGLTRLTDGDYDDIEPCRAADGGIVFVSSRCKRWVNCWCTQVAVLHRCDADGSGIRALSSNNEQDNTPWPMSDGRLIYTRWEYVDRSQVDYHHLWTANPDGTSQTVFYGNQRPSITMIDAKPVPASRRIAAIFSPGHGQRDHAGRLVLVDPILGPDDPSAARVISEDAQFRDPWPFAEDAFLVARGAEIRFVDGKGRSCAVHALSKEDRDSGFMIHEPRPMVARPGVRGVPDRVVPEESEGTLLVAAAHTGRNMAGVRPGEIKKLLVLESLPKPINFTGGMEPLTYGGSFTLERVVGTVPVEPDGSAHFRAPALRSLILVALDKDDLAVKRMQSFLTVQPGEHLSCVGCHEHRTQTAAPSRSLMALARPPSRIAPVAGSPDVFDFPRDIQPILDRRCASCHGYEKTDRGGPYAAGMIFTGDHGPMFSHSYFELTTRKLFSDGRNLARSNYAPRELGSAASRILKNLERRNATPEELRTVRLWIDAGAPYIGTYAGLGTGMIGGYAINQQVNTDFDWPTTRAGAAVMQRRCADCHKDNGGLPMSLSDERSMSFWRFEQTDPRHRFSRHKVFNLSRPEHSLLLLAPLPEAAGGFGLCRAPGAPRGGILAGTDDSDYRVLLAMVAAGKECLEKITRFDMADFQPRPEYIREMMRYGILPATFDPALQRVDAYDLDRRYWESLWHRPAPAVKGAGPSLPPGRAARPPS